MQEDQEDAMKGSLLGDINAAAGDMLFYAMLCSLDGWIGSYAWIGSDQIGLDQIQFRKGSEHPKV